MNATINTSNGHIINDNDDLKSSMNGLSSVDVSQNGSMLSGESQSPIRTTIANHHYEDSDSTSSSVNKNPRQPRTPEDFYLFCQFILEYANYNEMCDQEVRFDICINDLNIQQMVYQQIK